MRLIDADALIPNADYIDGKPWAVSITQIRNAPTAERVGHWEIRITPPSIGTYCSVCGWAWSDHIDAIKLNPTLSLIRTNYCPNCGAHMETTDV